MSSRRSASLDGGQDGNMMSGRNVAVVLGGMDQIVPAEAIRRYLTCDERAEERWVGKVPVDEDGVEESVSTEKTVGELEVLFNPRLDHAVIFDDAKWTRPLLDLIRRYVHVD